tara:strand:+ start:1699 stop:2739 length:1041 start_codon:yes stop_codon:yes gene_type:complete
MAIVKLQDKEIKKLKITVTNIKSVLISGNKNLSKLRLQKRKLMQDEISKKKVNKKVGGLKELAAAGGPKGMLIAAGIGIFSKIRSILEPIILGILVNTLPGISKKIMEVWESVKPAFTFVATIFKKIGDFLTFITKPIQKLFGVGEAPKTEDKQKQYKKDLLALDKETGGALKDVDSSNQELGEGDEKDESADNEDSESDVDRGIDDVNNEDSLNPIPITGKDKESIIDKTLKAGDKTNTIKGDLTTITVDGKKYPRGLSGPNETFGGKGGSTYPEIKRENNLTQYDRGGEIKSTVNKLTPDNINKVNKVNKISDISTLNIPTDDDLPGTTTVIVQRQIVEVPVPV